MSVEQNSRRTTEMWMRDKEDRGTEEDVLEWMSTKCERVKQEEKELERGSVCVF